MHILAADIGGTKSWLALILLEADGQQQVLGEEIYPSHDFGNATEMLEVFFSEKKATDLTIDHACLALPGIVSEDKAQLTNLDWQLDANELAKRFSISQVNFINDFQAAALGVTTLSNEDYLVLNEGMPEEQKIKVVTGAGTGLGMAWLNYENGYYDANPTEGGHVDFAPVNALQVRLLNELMEEYGHVSYERILSGDGLERLYRFMAGNGTDLSAKQITANAGKGDALAQQVLILFVEIYAAYVGNLAMLFKPQGGIYLAGGIAAKITSWMQRAEFIKNCIAKGRMQELVERTPIYLITNERLGLQGAILSALRQVG